MNNKRRDSKGYSERKKRRAAASARPPAGIAGKLLLDDLVALRQARALWAKDQIPRALQLFDRTARQHPNHALALIDASRAWGSVYQYARAESYLNRLLDLGGHRPDILFLVAQSYRLMRRPERAAAYFRKSIDAGSTNPDVQLELALLCERSNQPTAALEHANIRLKQKPNDDEGLLVRGRLLHHLGELRESEVVLRDLAKRRSAHWTTRMRAHAELASLCESQGAYDDAWNSMLEGKSIGAEHATNARKHRDRTVGPLTSLAQDISGAHVERWQAAAADKEPQPVALLTGMPRSGTTLLHQILKTHPSIASGDEWDVFPRLVLPLLLGHIPLQQLDVATLDRIPERHVARKRHMYFKSFASALDQSLTGHTLIDKNPSVLPLVPAYLRLLPNLKLIVSLRDPCDVVISCLMTYFPLNDFSVDFLTLESAVARLANDLNVWLTLRERISEQCIEYKYEDLVADYPSTVAEILNVAGLEWDDRLLDYRQQTLHQHVKSPSHSQVRLPVHRDAHGRWRRYARYLDPVMPQLLSLREELGYPSSGPV